MDLQARLTILADAAKYDASCASSGSKRERPDGGIGTRSRIGICHSYTPDGRCVSLLKILLTNYCIYDCVYCVNRVSSDTPRARFTRDEVVDAHAGVLQAELHRGPVPQLGHRPERRLHDGAARDASRSRCATSIASAATSISRLSPARQGAAARSGPLGGPPQREHRAAHAIDLDKLAPAKSHTEIESSMASIQAGIIETKSFARAGQSTQMIIGATPTPDARIFAHGLDSVQEHTVCAASTTRASARFPTPTRVCQSTVRRSSANTGFIRPTG